MTHSATASHLANNMTVTKTSKHILVVEDEQHLAVGIKYNLEAEKYQVTTVSDGPSALAELQKDAEIDLVILDIMLPGMSGYDVCQQTRELGNDIPVLILSARTLTEDRTRGFDVGADQYMTKPFDLDELLSRVKNLLTLYERRSNGRPPARNDTDQFVFGQAKVNFVSYEVTVKGESVRLTELEIKLLRYFIENEGRVIRREELLEEVWDVPGSISTRAVDQFVRRLRKIFEPDPSNPVHFLTVREAGYRFVAEPESSEPDDEDDTADEQHEGAETDDASPDDDADDE